MRATPPIAIPAIAPTDMLLVVSAESFVPEEAVGVGVVEVVTLGGSLGSDITVLIVNTVARPSSAQPSLG